MRYASVLCTAVALGALASAAVAGPMSVPDQKAGFGQIGLTELTDTQLDTLKAGAPNCAHVPNNPNCVTTNPGGQPHGCNNNPNCTTEFKPGSGKH